jgi:hypothetical protein
VREELLIFPVLGLQSHLGDVVDLQKLDLVMLAVVRENCDHAVFSLGDIRQPVTNF